MKRLTSICLTTLLLACPSGLALINPNFTPVELVEQADTIALLKLQPVSAAGQSVAQIVEVLKGEDIAPKAKLTFDTTESQSKDFADAISKMIEATADGPALLFVGRGENDEELGMLHVAGKWVSLQRTDDPALWLTYTIDPRMEATWAGGTDMLLLMTRLLVEDPYTVVPSASGVEWAEQQDLGTLQGKVVRLQRIDPTGDGNAVLHVACESGDRLFRFDKDARQLVDETGRAKLASTSRAAAWADLNADGMLDLLSWNGTSLTLHPLAANLEFGEPTSLAAAPEADCLGLAVVDSAKPGRPAIVWSSPEGPFILAGETATRVDAKPELRATAGTLGPSLVADFDADGRADIMQVGTKGGLFFRGMGKGKFEPAIASPVAIGPLPGDAFVGDWDMDGRFDVFCAGDDGPRLWHNYAGMRFMDLLYISGEIAYISKPGALSGNVCDVNNDGLQDVYIVYSGKEEVGPQVFFNRGFRSFGHSHTIDIREQGLLGGVEGEGQQCGLVADLNGDGAQDQVVVLKNGRMHFFPSNVDMFMPLCVNVALPLGDTRVGPVKVTGWDDTRCLGAWNVLAGVSEAFFGQAEPGATITFKWRDSNGKQHEKSVVMEDRPVRVTIGSD